MSGSNRIFMDILRHLACGDWPEGERIASLRELAEERGISTKPCMVAIRTAAAQGLLRVHPKSRAEVLPGAAELAKSILAGLSDEQRQRKIAILISEELFPLSERPSEAGVIAGIGRTAAGRGLHSEQIPVPKQGHMELARKIASGYDAAVGINLPVKMLPLVFGLRGRGLPLLMFRHHVPGRDDIPSVTADTYGAARRLAQMLINLGHRNMCLVSGQLLECQGWMDALKKADMIESCVLPVMSYMGWNPMGAIRHALSLRPRITALAVGYLEMLFWANEKGYLDGLHVPQDISIAVVSGAGEFRLPPAWPPITYAQMNVRRAAEIIIDGLLSMLKGETPPSNIRLPMDIVITDSIAAPPAAGKASAAPSADDIGGSGGGNSVGEN